MPEDVLKREYLALDKENDNTQINNQDESNLDQNQSLSDSNKNTNDIIESNIDKGKDSINEHKITDKSQIGGTFKKLWNKAFHKNSSSLEMVAEHQSETDRMMSESGSKEQKANPFVDSK